MIVRERYTKQPSAGLVTWNTISDLRGTLTQIAINPSVETTTYNFRLTDDIGTIVYDKKGLRGTFIDDTKIGVYGIYTTGILSASTSNNSFTVTFLWDENP